jgi:hypothetical protein
VHNLETIKKDKNRTVLKLSPNIIRVIKSRSMRWAEHVAGRGERKGKYLVLLGNLRERRRLEHLGVDRRIILKLILKKQNSACAGMI